MPRLAYAVKKNGDVVWIGRNHREIEKEHAGDVKHWGYFMNTGRELGHFPESTSRYAEPVPSEIMGEVETELKKHKKDVNIIRTGV